jgi:hypothetical protein
MRVRVTADGFRAASVPTQVAGFGIGWARHPI